MCLLRFTRDLLLCYYSVTTFYFFVSRTFEKVGEGLRWLEEVGEGWRRLEKFREIGGRLEKASGR